MRVCQQAEPVDMQKTLLKGRPALFTVVLVLVHVLGKAQTGWPVKRCIAEN